MIFPDMGNLLREIPGLFPDLLTFQSKVAPTENARGIPVPGGWANVDGLSQIPCLIETYVLHMRKGDDTEILSPEGQVEPNSYRVLCDHIYPVLAQMQAIDQVGTVYQVKEVTRDDQEIGTILVVQEVTA